MEEDNDLFLGGLKDCHNLQPLNLDSSPTHKTYSKLCSMVVIKDSSFTKDVDEDFAVFPPSNHENLIPSHFNLEPSTHSPPPSSPIATFSPTLPFLHSDSDPSPPPPVVSPLPRWWDFTIQILRSRVAGLGSYFGCNVGNDNKMSLRSFGNVTLAVTVVLWWLFARVKRWRRRKRVEHLMQIITEKDEKIMQLLSQIAQMNEVLLTRHKALASKLAS